MSVFVIRQLVESSQEGESARERIFSLIMTNYEPNIKPENGQPHEALKVDFGLVVLCAYLDHSDGQLKTRGWQMMARKTNEIINEFTEVYSGKAGLLFVAFR